MTDTDGPHINALPEPNNMGQSVTVLRDDTSPATILEAPGNMFGARVVTVDIGVTFADGNIPKEPTTGRTMALRGMIVWGAGNGKLKADFDIHNGTQLALPGASVELSVMFEEPTTPEDARFTEARVTGALVWGSRPTAPVSRTLPEVEVGQGESETFRVPRFAHCVRWFSPEPSFYSSTLSAVRLTFHGGPTTADDPSLVMSPAMGGFVARDAVPFAESARFVTVENLALGAFRVRPTFGLCL